MRKNGNEKIMIFSADFRNFLCYIIINTDIIPETYTFCLPVNRGNFLMMS